MGLLILDEQDFSRLNTNQYNVSIHIIGIRVGSSLIWFSEGNPLLSSLCDIFTSLGQSVEGEWDSWVEIFTTTEDLDSINFMVFIRRDKFTYPI